MEFAIFARFRDKAGRVYMKDVRRGYRTLDEALVGEKFFKQAGAQTVRAVWGTGEGKSVIFFQPKGD